MSKGDRNRRERARADHPDHLDEPGDPADDQLDVIYPSLAGEVLTDVVTRREWDGRMDGTDTAEQVKAAGRDVRVIALLHAADAAQWLATR